MGQLSQVPDRNTLRLWDASAPLYAHIYYASTDTIDNSPEILEGWLRASSRGWEFAAANPEEAVEMLIDEYPDLEFDSQLAGAQILLGIKENAGVEALGGFGWFDLDVWQSQIDRWDSASSTPTPRRSTTWSPQRSSRRLASRQSAAPSTCRAALAATGRSLARCGRNLE